MALPADVRRLLAEVERRRQARLERIRFQNNNRQYGRSIYGDFTYYPSQIEPEHHLNRGILGLDKILSGVTPWPRFPTIP